MITRSAFVLAAAVSTLMSCGCHSRRDRRRPRPPPPITALGTNRQSNASSPKRPALRDAPTCRAQQIYMHAAIAGWDGEDAGDRDGRGGANCNRHHRRRHDFAVGHHAAGLAGGRCEVVADAGVSII